MNKIIINGVEIQQDITRLRVYNGKITSNGVEVAVLNKDENTIKIEGDCQSLEVYGNVEITGNCQALACSGNVIVNGNIYGSISCSGNVICNEGIKQ